MLASLSETELTDGWNTRVYTMRRNESKARLCTWSYSDNGVEEMSSFIFVLAFL